MGAYYTTTTGMSRLQIICHWMAVFDILFYFATIIACVAVENVVSDLRPMKFNVEENGTVSVSFDEKNEFMAIWDYLNEKHYTSSSLYNAVYMIMVIIAVSYFIIEVWLTCVLIRGATERRMDKCKKWFWWRMSLMILTLVVAASDLYQHQYTLTLLLFIPLNVYRMSLTVIVLHLIGELNGDASKGIGIGKMITYP